MCWSLGVDLLALSAAWAAQQAGAEILVLELADTVGPTAAYAENYLLAGTQAQRDFGGRGLRGQGAFGVVQLYGGWEQ